MIADKKEKKIVYPTLKLDSMGTLILPNDIITQINYLHGRVGNTEWSGMLLYDVVSGNPANPKTFVLKAKHIFLMDIGNGVYTEYEPDGDIIDIYDNVENAMEMKTGHVHTHHTMSTFFSGTDISELNDNVDKHNYYLSLIVNFEGKYSAKVAFLSDTHVSSKFNYTDDGGKLKHFKTNSVEKSMVTIDMEIEYEYQNDFFYNRYDQIVENIKAKKAKAVKTYNGTGRSYYNNKEISNLPLKKGELDVDPSNMNDREVEMLTRNIISVTPELTEIKAVYVVLNTLVENTTEADLDFYYTYLGKHLEKIISSFFDQELDMDEMLIVLTEVLASINRFSGLPNLVEVVNGINEVIQEFIITYEAESIANEEDNLADEILELETEIENAK